MASKSEALSPSRAASVPASATGAGWGAGSNGGGRAGPLRNSTTPAAARTRRIRVVRRFMAGFPVDDPLTPQPPLPPGERGGQRVRSFSPSAPEVGEGAGG